ncbi:MAG: hypothetical protein KME46_04520 [Brasilonema angustatum HA4187-MV1]|jgi:hypothetical protein|nr:hypothetical protein [Brasilonema angustatum HA4187-MV1]
MSISKRPPLLSLALLLLTYTSTGWIISKIYTPWYIWLLAVIAILLLTGGLTVSGTRVANFSLFLFKSNVRSFGLSVLAAFLFFLMIVRFRLFLETLLIVAATGLVRIDFQTAGFNQGQTFCLLSIFCLTGLALGALIHKLI